MPTEKSDAERSLALLWGAQDRPNRGPKPALTVDVIVRAAIKIADTEGMAALSMRRVAETLGVGTMSLYTYVPAKAELFELMVDTVLGETPLPEPGPGGWRAWLERFARNGLDGYRRHPWLLEVSLTRGLMGPNQTAALDALLHAISGIGLSKGEMMAVVQLVVGYVRGVAQSTVESARLEQRTGVTDEQWWTEVAPLHDKYIDAGRFPTLTAVFSAEDWDEWIDAFEFGLQRVLDGIESFVDARATS
ncbi:MAG TPA: TetR/AcrR family transcriptional regulator [Actinophytocola sp.]|uniref:TetR/AcrR family transcriptional regulator n=1 Tax=Actinophytocola sp. TaxID=1872138 RepID=UPI002DDCC2CA|nr:TetR/AcrR family transcriptional regulator [Actinophytocola sp.]HEV2779273.1 TetR/AcrR family transcriptional regulator [Actinophytocola sp.]